MVEESLNCETEKLDISAGRAEFVGSVIKKKIRIHKYVFIFHFGFVTARRGRLYTTFKLFASAYDACKLSQQSTS